LSVLVLDKRKRPVMPCSEKRQPTPKAGARGADCRTKLMAHGSPRRYCLRTKSVRGFQTGDVVRAEVPTGKKAGTHVGRVAVRGSGSLRVGKADGINAKYCKLFHRAGGCCYANPRFLPVLKNGV
jgi:hypothetical protein